MTVEHIEKAKTMEHAYYSASRNSPKRAFSSQAPRGNMAVTRNRNDLRGPRCYGCNEYGHIRRDCPKENDNKKDYNEVALGAMVKPY